MRFQFQARRADGPDISSRIGISEPVASGDAFFCVLKITGFDELEVRVHGAFPFQAADLAFSLARTIMASHEGRWSFVFDGEAPVTFAYPR